MSFPSYVIESLPHLQKVAKLGPHRQHLFDQIYPRNNKCCFKTIINFAANVLYNETLQLSPAVISRLRPHKKVYQALASSKVQTKKKLRLIRRQGNKFVPPLLAALLHQVRHHVNRGKAAQTSATRHVPEMDQPTTQRTGVKRSGTCRERSRRCTRR